MKNIISRIKAHRNRKNAWSATQKELIQSLEEMRTMLTTEYGTMTTPDGTFHVKRRRNLDDSYTVTYLDRIF